MYPSVATRMDVAGGEARLVSAGFLVGHHAVEGARRGSEGIAMHGQDIDVGPPAA